MSENKQKGEGMSVVTFLRGAFRCITNYFLDEDEGVKYEESLATNRPTTTSKGVKIQAVEIGMGWRYPLLENKLNARGKKFRVAMIGNRELDSLVQARGIDIDDMVASSNFAWANATSTFFIKIDGYDGFDLSYLGMVGLDAKKLPKRMQEITRIAELDSSGKMEDLDYELVTSGVLPFGDLAYDGPIFVRRSFALRAAKSKNRLRRLIHKGEFGPAIARFITDKGEIKGLLHIVDDEQLLHDVVVHESALKRELLMTDGHWSFTAFRMSHYYKSVWNFQTAANNHNWLYTEQKFMQDLSTMVDEFKQSMEAGEIPEWILFQEQDNHDEDQISRHQEHVTAYWQEQARKLTSARWQQMGFSVDASASVLKMAFGSVKNQMSSALSGDKPRFWVPVTNAFSATIVTAEALRDLGGFDIDTFIEENCLHGKVFFVENVGLVIPAKRFIDTEELHDTWDQDGDAASVEKILLWSSDPAVTDLRRIYGVIPQDMEVPSTPEEAIEACVVIRSPNQPGGYSIELYDSVSMPFMRQVVNPTVVDLADTPSSLTELLNAVNCGNVVSNKTYTGRKFTRDNAKEAILAQMNNPGIGSYANAIMVYASVFGPQLPQNLPFSGNDLIDITAQTADQDAFDIITDGVDDLWETMASINMEVDEFMFENRVPKKVRDDNNWTVVKSSWSRMHEAYVDAISEISKELNKNTFAIRQRSNFVKFMKTEIPTLPAGTQEWAKQFWSKYENLLKRNDMEHSIDRKMDRYTKASLVASRSDSVADIVRQMVDELRQTSLPGKYAMALYRWIVDERMTRQKYGVSDRIVFQGGKPGQETVMDVMLEGLFES